MGTLVSGGLRDIGRSLASPLNKSFNVFRFDLGTRDMWVDLAALVRRGLGGHWLGAPATFGFMVPISLRRFELKLFIKLKTILTLLVKLEN